MRKISVISSSRADYGILKNLIKDLQNEKKIRLNFYLTGANLSNIFGNTIKQIKKDKIKIKKKIFIKSNIQKKIDISDAISQGIKKFSNEFKINQPDLLIILGDRYEIFSVAVAAFVQQIPIAHLHGGELTEGALDDSLRHAITKMSQIHFVSTRAYANRLIQLGENKKFIFNVGSLGVENIKKINLLSLNETYKKYNLELKKKTFIITLHPETLLEKNTRKNTKVLLEALAKFDTVNLVFTMPNADLNYKQINNLINNFCRKHKNSYYFKSLGQKDYFSLCRYASCVIGNSSSGIIEIPSLSTPTVNLGIRQKGRVLPKTVINTNFSKKNIIKSIHQAVKLKKYYVNKKKIIYKNPYEKKDTSKNIIKVLKTIKLKNILIKEFKDIKLNKYGN